MDDERDLQDALAEMRAAADQAHEAAKEMAKMLWQFHSTCVEEGFTAADAFRLTIEFMRTQLSNGGGEDGSDD